MEIKMTESGTFELLYDKFDVILNLAAIGFTIAVVFAIIVAGIRLGWSLMPYIIVLAVLAYIFV